MKVIEETKEDNYLAVSLVEIDSNGTVVDVPSAPAGAEGEDKEEKKTLSLVIKEIAGKILGNAEAKDGDPNLPGEGDKVTPEVTLIV
ncbi:MAG: hypothetical protein K6E68_07275 [Lachnospiraceae bacterium]|nr:hypothetical protein [Lachnospiraceae bacterium]